MPSGFTPELKRVNYLKINYINGYTKLKRDVQAEGDSPAGATAHLFWIR